MSYIKREDALTDAMCVGISCQECPFLINPVYFGCKIENYIKSIPAADVIERNALQHSQCVESVENALDVEERKVGKWEKYGEDMQVCSACHKYWIWAGEMYDFKYCPNCGAKMEG